MYRGLFSPPVSAQFFGRLPLENSDHPNMRAREKRCIIRRANICRARDSPLIAPAVFAAQAIMTMRVSKNVLRDVIGGAFILARWSTYREKNPSAQFLPCVTLAQKEKREKSFNRRDVAVANGILTAVVVVLVVVDDGRPREPHCARRCSLATVGRR